MTLGRIEITKLLLENGANVSISSVSGLTPLHVAAENAHFGRTQIAQLLISHDVGIVNATDDSGLTPLHSTVMNCEIMVEDSPKASNHCLEFVELLITKGANVNSQALCSQTECSTPLDSVRNNEDLFRLLVAHGAKTYVAILILDRKLLSEKHYASDHKLLADTIRSGKDVIADLILKEGMDQEGKTSLHKPTLLLKDPILVKALISKGADVNARDNNGRTPSHWAAAVGAYSALEIFIANGANINSEDIQGNTPLHLSSQKGYDAVVKLLVANGANFKAKDKDLFTPLHWASYTGHKLVAEVLVRKGAQVNAKEEDGRTPLYWAAIHNHSEIAALLIAMSANVNSHDDKFGDTPLHVAAENGHREMVALLLKHSADVNAKNTKGRTALHFAAFKGHLLIVELLVTAGADVFIKDGDGATPEFIATINHHRNVASFLKKVQTNKATTERESTLFRGRDVRARDNLGKTPLHYAAMMGLREDAEKIIDECEACIDAIAADGETPLHKAAFAGHTAVVELLIMKGAKLNVRDSFGRTPLYWAIISRHTAVVKLLITEGADVNAIDSPGGRTAQYWANRFGYKDIVDLLNKEEHKVPGKI